jgi:hypothetical protein
MPSMRAVLEARQKAAAVHVKELKAELERVRAALADAEGVLRRRVIGLEQVSGGAGRGGCARRGDRRSAAEEAGGTAPGGASSAERGRGRGRGPSVMPPHQPTHPIQHPRSNPTDHTNG